MPSKVKGKLPKESNALEQAIQKLVLQILEEASWRIARSMAKAIRGDIDAT